MLYRFLTATLGVLAFTSFASAEELSISFERYELDNGLEVVLSEDHSTPLVHVEVWYHVGSKDEPQGRSGFAHLFEHLMFNGSKHWDDEYFTPLQPFGARINGTTNTERTNYFETVPSNVLELALWMEADRMGFLLEALTQEKLDNQRDVVRNERRQNYEMRPYGEVRGAQAEAVWPEDHPYHRLTIGSHEDLEAATLDDVKEFFATWYVPNNATLAIVGDFDEQQTKAWIEDYFGGFDRGPQPSPILEASAPLPVAQTIEMTDDVKLPRVFLIWQSMPLYAQGDADLDVLSSLLADGKNSALYRSLVFEERIAKDVRAAQYSARLGSTYNITATAAPGKTAEAVLAALEKKLASLLGGTAASGKVETTGTDRKKRYPNCTNCAQPRERPEAVLASLDKVQTAVNNWKKSFFQRMESVTGRSGLLLTYNNMEGDPGWVQKDLDRYLAVTPESVMETARRVLDDAHRVTIIVRPEADAGGER